MQIGIYPTLVIILLFMAAIFSPRKRWKCPAPGCDFSVEEDKEHLAAAHKALHAKHAPALKD